MKRSKLYLKLLDVLQKQSVKLLTMAGLDEKEAENNFETLGKKLFTDVLRVFYPSQHRIRNLVGVSV